MRSLSPIYYLVGTPKGRLTRLEKKFLELPWKKARESELYVLVESQDRVHKERSMRERRVKKLDVVEKREGRYLLRSNLVGENPESLWEKYILLTEVEQAFKYLKGDLLLRPIYHQKEERIEAHIFVAFKSYCLFVTLKQRLKALAPGLIPKAVLDKLGEIQMIDVHLPTADGREIKLSRYTQPTRDHQMLLNQMKLDLPSQPPPRISGKGQVVR